MEKKNNEPFRTPQPVFTVIFHKQSIGNPKSITLSLYSLVIFSCEIIPAIGSVGVKMHSSGGSEVQYFGRAKKIIKNYRRRIHYVK